MTTIDIDKQDRHQPKHFGRTEGVRADRHRTTPAMFVRANRGGSAATAGNIVHLSMHAPVNPHPSS
jgi:hypothetical protein